jgi:DNA sulfur modification protein DndC
MGSQQRSIFEDARLQMTDSIRLTAESLNAHGRNHDHWAMAYSGGKDSTTALTVTAYLIASGQVRPPRRMTVIYGDTRQEIPALAVSAAAVLDELRGRSIEVRTAMAPLDKRFLVYILGRGVPPPNNNTMRWCTRQIKVDPMADELRRLVGEDEGRRVLMITGVRVGESAARDQRIALSCSRDGAECGQGWYQHTLPGSLCATLAPIVHWRVCHVWEWLKHWATRPEFGDWDTAPIADAYGGEEAEEINARTGCICCPLASRDTALEALIASPRWSYLAPLKELRDLYRSLRLPENRLRKPGGERRKDGTLSRNQNRMGPITLDSRARGLETVLDVQARVNAAAAARLRPTVDILNAEEESRIRELIAAGTWPEKWTGGEPTGDEPFEEVWADGTVQPLMFPTINGKGGML